MRLTRNMVSELKTLETIIESESDKITDRALREKWTVSRLQFELEALYDYDTSEVHESIQKKTTYPNSRIMDKAKLQDKYSFKGKKYSTLMGKIITENQEKIVSAVGHLDKKKIEKALKNALPVRAKEKIVKMPLPMDVMRRSNVIRKAADNGQLMSKTRRLEMNDLIKRVLKNNQIETLGGTVSKNIHLKVKKELNQYFVNYTKNSPPYGVPKNLHAIAVTETKGAINNMRHVYMQESSKVSAKEGYAIYKKWRHNASLSISKKPRKNHIDMGKEKAISINEPFLLKRLDGKPTISINNPHDSMLPASEVVSCNCDVYYFFKRLK